MIKEAKKVIRVLKDDYDCILVHLLTNDIKDKTFEECIQELDALITMITSKFKSAYYPVFSSG